MSSAKLLLSGLLVAGGLILGAFTLHGYFDPQWPQKHMHAAREPAKEPKATNTFQSRTQFVATPSFPQDADAPQQVVKTSAKPDAQPPDVVAADPEAAAAKAAARKKRAEARRKLEETRLAEKAERERIEKAKQKPQQATFKWPWSW